MLYVQNEQSNESGHDGRRDQEPDDPNLVKEPVTYGWIKGVDIVIQWLTSMWSCVVILDAINQLPGEGFIE